MNNDALGRQDVHLAIQVLRPLLIVVMCWAHIPILWGFLHPPVTTEVPVSVLGTVLRDTLSRGAVPVLTVISGYLAYASFERKSYGLFVTEKLQRVLLPFLLWNVVLLLYLHYLNLAFDKDIDGLIARLQSPADVLLAVVGYNQLPVNAPTYFLRDLFLILLCVPAIDLVTRNRAVGIGIIVLLGLLVLSVFPLYFSIRGHGVLYRNDMPLFFMIGYVFARHGPTLHKQADWKAIVGVAGFVGACVATSFWLVAEKPPLLDFLRYRPVFGLYLVLILPYALSFIARHRDAAVVGGLRRLSPYSFTIFLSHMVVVHYLGGGLSDPLSLELAEFKLSNFSPFWLQAAFVCFYTALCVGLGVAIKLVRDTTVGLLERRPTA